MRDVLTANRVTEMSQARIPAIFMRGGSSKGVFFHDRDLPPLGPERDALFLSVIGSPDPYGRQLNGMGGGVSSLSKAVAIAPPSRDDADLDYIFAQVAVGQPVVDYSANCGNLSSAVGPFAIDYGVLDANGGDTHLVRIHNTNTSKIIHAHVPVEDGRHKVEGDFSIPGVAGSGARIRLDFVDPGGAATGRLLPTGNVTDTISLGSDGEFEVSIVDASAGCVFVAAERLGLTGAESVADLEARGDLMAMLDRLRRAAGVTMGLAETADAVPPGTPKLGIVAPPHPYLTLANEEVVADRADIAARMLSMGQIHRVLPLTGALCLAVACRVPGTICNALTGGGDGDLRLANPSGVLPVDALVEAEQGGPVARSVTAYRTARALMEGHVLVPGA